MGISGPAQVNAKAYPGANLITWSFTKDAKSYTVYRQRSDGSDALVLLKTTGTQSTESPNTTPVPFSYLDVVGFKNQLAHEVEYTYYVTANSGQGATARAIELADNGGTLINDGASSVRVTANIPPRETEVTKLVLDPEKEELTAASIIPEPVENELLITWPNYNPAFEYAVRYDLGKTLTLNIEPSEGDSEGNATSTDEQGWDSLKYYKVPLFGGINTLRLTVTLGDGLYYKPAELSKELGSYALTELPEFASDAINVARSGTSATISWEPISGVSANEYKLYRIEAKGLTDDEEYTSDQVEVVGDWVAVAGTQIPYDDNGTSKIKVVGYRVGPRQGVSLCPLW